MSVKAKYQKIRNLGQGTYGQVQQAVDKSTGQRVAIKKIKFTEQQQDGIPPTALREIAILRSLNHVNVLKLLDVVYNAQARKLSLVFEFIEEDLCQHYKRRKLTSLQVKSYVFQILKGLQYLQSCQIMHRDLKPQNILVSKEGIIKLADFGLARVFQLPFPTLSPEIQTLWYRAPELLLGIRKYDLSVDMWSVGCIFHQLYLGQVLFQSNCDIGQIIQIFNRMGTPTPEEWPQFGQMNYFKQGLPRFQKRSLEVKNLQKQGKQLLRKMCEVVPASRISVKEALNSRYFQGLYLQFY